MAANCLRIFPKKENKFFDRRGDFYFIVPDFWMAIKTRTSIQYEALQTILFKKRHHILF